MSEETENLVLEQLRRIRASQERTEIDIQELKVRVSAIEVQQGQMITLLGGVESTHGSL